MKQFIQTLFSLIVFALFIDVHAATLTAKDLELHSSPTDCWIAIDGKAYDISKYIPKHPAPASALTKYCGKDASVAWKTKDKGKSHSRAAERLLRQYEKGAIDLNSEKRIDR